MTTAHWDFDLSHSSINFHVRHLMVSKVHGRFAKWSGTLELDEQDLADGGALRSLVTHAFVRR